MKTKKLLKSFTLFLVLSVFLSMVTIAADTKEFVDAGNEDYFYPAVQWGVEAGITYGVDEDHFAPEGNVTRAQVVTFLWRMAGQPTPAVTETFNDVEAGSWYETAVQWAVENDITAGTGAGMFSPESVCDRAMCITLLYRMMGSPMDGIDLTASVELNENMTMEDFGFYLIREIVKEMRSNEIFMDVPEDSYYELPVIWGCLNGIINDDNTGILENGIMFRAADPCVRKEMISFLYQTKLMQDAANAPETYELGPITIPFPQEYSELLYRNIYGTDEGEDVDEEVIIVIQERASKEAAEAMGEDVDDGVGELFRIIRVSENRLHEMLCGDMSGEKVFAKDSTGKYYVICYPTDVRYVRETNEKMNEDIEQWTKLNSWARGDLPDDIIECSSDLSAVTFTNTMLDMYLARIAYAKDVKYTISTTEYGPLEPGKFDGTKYAEYLLDGNFVTVDEKEAPDGEYVVLNFPDEEVRYDFFTADENLVREIRGDYTTFYRRAFPGSVTNTEAMQGWYYDIAEQTGKKEDYKELDPFIGEWHEEIAGRGTMTITKSVGLAKVDIEARWPGSAFEVSNWSITANLTEDGKLVYNNGKHTVTEYDESGMGKVVSENTNESGLISINSDGKLVWSYQNGEQSEESVFVRNN